MLRVTCYVLRVTCYVLRVTCYMLHVTCYMLHVTCYEFVQDQENKNTSSKTQRGLLSLKTLLVSILDLLHIVFLDRSSKPLLVHSPFKLTYCTIKMCLKLCFSQCCWEHEKMVIYFRGATGRDIAILF